MTSSIFNPMLNRKTAAENATKHLGELIPIDGTPVVEEHYLTDGVWQITLSYVPAMTGVQTSNGHGPLREFKSFSVDARTGEVLAMKIRGRG